MKYYKKSLKEKTSIMPHRILTVGRQSQLTKEPTIDVCSVLTVIRDKELTSRRSEMQPVRQNRKQR